MTNQNDQSNGPYSASQKTTPVTIDMSKSTCPKCDAPQNSLIDSITNPNVKTTKG
jgi:hypothetical protein